MSNQNTGWALAAILAAALVVQTVRLYSANTGIANAAELLLEGNRIIGECMKQLDQANLAQRS